uniref:PhzF family phenazine biosynthesis protein n=1 Tax=Steinernema glaseri TaxID=37863 RepID=A0A1I7YJ56_9BILA
MSTPVYFVDAFTNAKFCGNQAAVCLFDTERSDEEYQRIAAEFNLSETAIPLPLNGASFKRAERFSLRWFTPTNEVNLCGHATLATAHVIFKEIAFA